MENEPNITLEDIDTAIKILMIFLKRQKQAEMIVRRLGIGQRTVGMSGLSFEQFVNMAYQQVMEKKKVAEGGEPEPEPQLTEEELAKMHEIANKLKKGKVETQA